MLFYSSFFPSILMYFWFSFVLEAFFVLFCSVLLCDVLLGGDHFSADGMEAG